MKFNRRRHLPNKIHKAKCPQADIPHNNLPVKEEFLKPMHHHRMQMQFISPGIGLTRQKKETTPHSLNQD